MNGRAAILLAPAGLWGGSVFRCVCRAGKHRAKEWAERLVWRVMNGMQPNSASPAFPHMKLRRSCAKLCHSAGGELDQIQFPAWTRVRKRTERYLGCKQRIRVGVNDHIGIEP